MRASLLGVAIAALFAGGRQGHTSGGEPFARKGDAHDTALGRWLHDWLLERAQP